MSSKNICAMSKPLKPQIRFKGYDDEWQLKSLSDVCHSFKYGLNASATIFDGKHKYLRITDIDDDNNTFNKDDLTSPDISCFTDEYKLSVKDIVFARTGASVGKTYLYDANDGNVYWAGFLIRATVNQNYDENFVFQNTLTNRYWRYIGIASQRSGQPGVNATEYGEFDFHVAPRITEQREIGEYFKQIDTQIKEAEREVDRLEKMKIASLQKMFPRPGATTPEIRFAGFSNPWKEMTFKEVYSSLKNNTLSRDCLNYNNGIAKNIHYGDVLIKFGAFVNPLSIDVPYVNSNVSLDRSSSYKLADGDVIFADTAEDEAVGKCTEIRGVSDIDVVSGLHTIAVRPKFEFAPYYLGYYHNSNAYHFQLVPLMQGVKVLSINRTAIADTMVAFPTSLDEQRAIGEYFRNLDELIAAKRKSIVKLRNIKKACLSKMFVNDTEL